MAIDIYQGSMKIGSVSTSGEVYFQDRKVGWANGNGTVYLNGIPFGWVTLGGSVLDRRDIPVGHVDSDGKVFRGNECVGRVENAAARYYKAGAALLLLLGRFSENPANGAVQ